MRRPALVSIALVIAIAVSGCALPMSGRSPVTPTDAARTRPAPKSLVVGILQEPTGFGPFHSCTSGGGCHQLEEIGMRYLVGLDNQSRPYPEVALRLPAVEDGSWMLHVDGTMETTYKLRPGVLWHDGTPMVADDWVFGWEVDHDSGMPNHSTVPVRYIDSAMALDDNTLVLHWSQTYPHANALIREHLLSLIHI